MFAHVYEILLHRAMTYPNATALGGQHGLGWRTFTSRQLLDTVDSLAVELAAEDIVAGDRVVLWTPNNPQTPIYLFALWKLGAVVVPFDREMNPEAAADIITSVEPRRVIVGYGERPVWARGDNVVEWWEPGSRVGSRQYAVGSGDEPSAVSQQPSAAGPHPHPLPAGEGTELPSPSGRGDGGEGTSLSTQHSALSTWSPPAEELAAIFFTSGTTGRPKGCMITHANLCSQVDALHYAIPLGPTCRLASILPLSHLFEMTGGLLYPLASGAAIHYIPSRRGPDIVRVLAEQRITHMIAVPQLLTMMGGALEAQLQAKLPARVYQAMNAAAERLPLPARRILFWPVHRKIGGSLRQMASGGAALPAETHRLWERLGVRVTQGLGTSECSPIITTGTTDGSTPIGSVGKPLRNVEVRLSAEGEVLVRGPNVMRGYWQDPERTAEVLRDGWYHTGDLATVDGDGNYFLAGRARDLIVLPSGLKVWPQDVEDVLRSHPAVKDAVVLPVPTPGGGATLHAYLIPSGAGPADISSIVATSNARLAQHQRLASASWWPEDDFPRTATGLQKVQRHRLPLPDAVAAVKIDSVMAADDPVSQAIAGAARMASVAPTLTLAELGFDSLGLVELALALEEKTGKVVADSDLRLDMTVEQVRAFVAQAPIVEEGDTSRGAGGREQFKAEQPLWPYTWGRIFRFLDFPFDLIYRYGVTRTVVLGGEHLRDLPPRIILAGTHHGFADMPLVRRGLRKTPARRRANRLVCAAQAGGFSAAGLAARYGILAFGLYPLRQFGDRDVSLRQLARLAGLGNPVLIFPQGIHALPEQERAGDPVARFKPGVSHLAQALEAAVVPFGLAGTEHLMPAHLDDYKGPVIAGIPVKITRGPLAIAFGPPLTMAPDETPHAFAARLQAASFALTRQAEAAIAPPPGGS